MKMKNETLELVISAKLTNLTQTKRKTHTRTHPLEKQEKLPKNF